MYHRYQPTENGQYRRQTVPDAPKPSPPPRREQEAPSHHAPPPPVTPSHVPKPEHAPAPHFQLPFLEKLLPNMDQGDLLLLLIMLLLISEGNEDSSSVVMTLAIFLFLQ